ncbi:MAG TPA: type II toxin-antitoxin system VapC family toxin [Chthoniobacterales bacterium]
MTFDTCFLIDLQRERRRGEAGAACRFAEAHAGQTSYLSAVAWGEFSEGFAAADAVFLAWQASFEILPLDGRVAWQYSRLVRELRARGQLIGSNDLWICATALAHHLPLVTRNAADFQRIPGLKVLGY